MFKKPNNSGWILCPSKSYPGKFYYFNVLNGEAAWSLNENEKKAFKKEVTIQKVKENHLYPEPINPPDHPRPKSSNYHSTNKTSLPTFGQAIFPKYISNNKEDIPIMWKPNRMLQLVTNSKKLVNQNTQTEQDNMYVHTCKIPLSKRFDNKINESIGSINYVTTIQPKDWCNSPNIWSNIHKQSDNTDMQYKGKSATKPILRELKFKTLECTNKKDFWNKNPKQDSIQMHCNKADNTKAMTNKMLINLDINDLRHVLKAKKRKCDEKQDLYKVNKEQSRLNDTKKVTFNIRDDNTIYSEKEYIGEGATYKNNQNLQTSGMYIVVDLDVLLEDYEFINRYIDKDEDCHLYVPSVILNQLKTLSMGEHGGRSRVIVARQLLRQLGSITPRLNLPENKEDTKMHQIINCCLEIMKLSYDVVLVTKDIGLLQTAKLYKIQAYHINEIKSDDLKNNFFNTYKHNLFLQNTSDFDPFTLSKVVGATRNNYRHNNSGINKELLIDDVYDVNISDINQNFSKLNINDKILNIKRQVKNNLFQNKIVKTNDMNNNFKTLFHNISVNNTVQRNTNEDSNNMSNKKESINITFNTNKEKLKNNSENNLEHHTNVNLITKPMNEVFENKKATSNIFEDRLKKFHIKNNIMEHNLYVRFDEWVCFYEQLFEDFLHIILQKNMQQLAQPPPWFLHEGMECLKDIYRDNKYIINIIEKFLYYYDFSSEYGTNIKPYNFMKLFGCGFYLVEALEKTSPTYISDIKKKLLHLRDMLECPVEDLLVDIPVGHGDTHTEDTNTCETQRYIFVKNPSDVLDYLKKHFSEWKNYNEVNENTNQIEHEVHNDNIRVLRTFGRDLNKLTINKSKCLSFTKETDKQTHKCDVQSNDYPKVIRNIKLLETFEEKFKMNENGLGCPEIAETISSISLCRNDNKAIINDRVAETNDVEIVSVNSDSQNNDINDSTKDSGIGSNSLHAYSLVRSFLSELSSSFKIIHTFIDESIKDYSEDIDEENKKNLYEKANKTHTHIGEIIDKLKIIIQRESKESSTLKSLLIKAGRDDKRTSRYRPVVMKCLEQATVLENSLKLMLAITNEEVISVASKDNIQFINIFE